MKKFIVLSLLVAGLLLGCAKAPTESTPVIPNILAFDGYFMNNLDPYTPRLLLHTNQTIEIDQLVTPGVVVLNVPPSSTDPDGYLTEWSHTFFRGESSYDFETYLNPQNQVTGATMTLTLSSSGDSITFALPNWTP